MVEKEYDPCNTNSAQPACENFCAVILAAGMSRRMGQPKLILPWGQGTVITQIVSVLVAAGVTKIIVVTGAYKDLLEKVLQGYPVELVWNARYAEDQMLLSLQTGLSRAPSEAQAAFVVIGDQPQIQKEVFLKLMSAYSQNRPGLVVPSYQMRRGHPWLVDRSLWPDLLNQTAETRLRDWLNQNSARIRYIEVDSESILRDLDTPEDYAREIGDSGR